MTKAHQLANTLAQQIFRQEIREGQRLPSERQLCEEFGLARNTVRRQGGKALLCRRSACYNGNNFFGDYYVDVRSGWVHMV